MTQLLSDYDIIDLPVRNDVYPATQAELERLARDRAIVRGINIKQYGTQSSSLASIQLIYSMNYRSPEFGAAAS